MYVTLALLACTTTTTATPDPATEHDEVVEVVDVFDGADDPAVDLLFVVDNSSSMADEQGRLVANFPALWHELTGSEVDVHVGVTATDTQHARYSGKLREYEGERYLTGDTPDPSTAFGAMVDDLGVVVGSVEAGRQATWMAIETQAQFNAGFLRDQAELHVFFVSDADDQTPDTEITPTQFADWAATLKDPADWLQMHAIVMPSPAPSTCIGFRRPGLSYLQYADDTGGMVQSICEDDWSPIFEQVPLGASGAGQQFVLSQQPDPATLSMVVDGTSYDLCQAPGTGCVDLDEDTLTARLLGVRIPADADIEIRYQPAPEE